MSVAINVWFSVCGPSTNHEEESLCIVEMPSAPEKDELVILNGKPYDVVGRQWEIMPESDMQRVRVLLQDR